MLAAIRRFALVFVVTYVSGQVALGGTYSDPSGFSLNYPAGWFAVNRELANENNQNLPHDFQDWVAKHGIDLNQIAVVVSREGDDEAAETLNVVVQDKQIPVNDQAVKQMEAAMAQQLRNMGIAVETFHVRIENVGSRDVIAMEWRARMFDMPDLLHQKQYMIPGGGKTYIVTCSALSSTFARYRQAFDSMLASFQAPAPIASGLDLSAILKNGAIWGVVGGVVGGLIAVMRKVTGRK